MTEKGSARFLIFAKLSIFSSQCINEGCCLQALCFPFQCPRRYQGQLGQEQRYLSSLQDDCAACILVSELASSYKSHPNIKCTLWMSAIWGYISPEIFFTGNYQLHCYLVASKKQLVVPEKCLIPFLHPFCHSDFQRALRKKLHHAFMSTENMLPALQWKAQSAFASSTTQLCSRFRGESCKPDTLPLSGTWQLALGLMWNVGGIPYCSQTLNIVLLMIKYLAFSLTPKTRLKNTNILAFCPCVCYTGAEEGLILKHSDKEETGAHNGDLCRTGSTR